MSFGHFISGSITIEKLEFNYKDYQGNKKVSLMSLLCHYFDAMYLLEKLNLKIWFRKKKSNVFLH